MGSRLKTAESSKLGKAGVVSEGEGKLWVGVPMIFLPELAGKRCHISYKAEMVEVEGKGLVLSKVLEGKENGWVDW